MIEMIIQGVLLGGLYCLFALGLSVMFGVMRLANLAHGDLIIAAGYAAIVCLPMLGGHTLLVPFTVIPIWFVVGYLLQKYILNRTVGKDPLPSLVVTFGLSIIIQNVLLEVFSADSRSIDSDGLSTSSFTVGDINIGVLPFLILVVALLCTVLLQWIFNRTSLGRAFRAVSDDREIAELMGLDANKVYAIATALSFALVAIAGIFQGIRVTISPADGPMVLIFAFEAVIIGGLGSFWGTMIGAIILGLVQSIGFMIDPGWGYWFGHLAFLTVLVIRPQGLFPKTKG